MKNKIACIIAISLLLVCVAPVFAVKPSSNLAAAQKVAWNLSADVMPVPPYGSGDIPGSDEASKLIVNQPNGAVEVVLNGVMNNLNPDTTYTVYLSNSYTPYEYTGWDITGDWILRAVLGSSYDHDYTFTQTGESFGGTGGYPATGPPYSITETVTGTINPLTGEITLRSDYNTGYWYTATATIASDGSISGTFKSYDQGTGSPWYSTSGTAVKTHTGNTGWPGLFTSTVQPFTFTTDEYGSGNWHINLKNDNFPGDGTYDLSVWINKGGTILISDVFTVVVE